MFYYFNKEIIEDALDISGHQYIVGNLKKPQEFSYLPDGDINIGIGNHSKYEWESAHYHTDSNEYQYVIHGEAKYVDLDNNKEYLVKEGDFFVITINTRYILKAKAQTRILFVKHPARDDKHLIEMDERIKCWVEKWENTWDE